jgi:hypothetical protein
MTHNSSVTKDSKTSEVLKKICIPAYASLDLFHFKIYFKICCFLYGITIFSGSYRKNWLLPEEKNSNEGGYCESDLTLAGALLQSFLPTSLPITSPPPSCWHCSRRANLIVQGAAHAEWLLSRAWSETTVGFLLVERVGGGGFVWIKSYLDKGARLSAWALMTSEVHLHDNF